VANFGERYELIRRLGSGGMGEVWLAHDEQLGDRPVAIKIMHQHMLPNSGDVSRFEREMRIAAMMDHPNIVTVYTTGTYNGAPYMVMEYLKGQDLERALPDGSAERVAAIGRDICRALAYAHDKGVIHRDIKPGNLFLCDSGPVKVTDFGIARAVGGTTLSSPGILVGTFAYMPPEQWRGEAPAFSNDIWAVGCVLYRLISGRPPRVFPGAAEYAAAAMRGDPVPDLRDVADAPDWLSGTVMAMLATDPARRPTADQCVRSLSGMPSPGQLAGRTVPTQPSPSPPGPGPVEPGPAPVTPVLPTSVLPVPGPADSGRPRHPARILAAIGGGAALLIAGSVIAVQFHGSPKAPEPAVAGPASSPGHPQVAARTPAASTLSSPSHSAVSPVSSPAAPSASSSKVSVPSSAQPSLVAVPNVVGLSFGKARLVLEGDGFRVVGRHARLGQIVTGTSPSGQAPAGSVIIVVYGTGL